MNVKYLSSDLPTVRLTVLFQNIQRSIFHFLSHFLPNRFHRFEIFTIIDKSDNILFLF